MFPTAFRKGEWIHNSFNGGSQRGSREDAESADPRPPGLRLLLEENIMRQTSAVVVALLAVSLLCPFPCLAQRISDATTALHTMQPDYRTPYGSQSVEGIASVLKRVHSYLDGVTPMQLVDRRSDSPIADLGRAGENAIFAQGDFRLISYEWGVTYAGMLNACRATGISALRIIPQNV